MSKSPSLEAEMGRHGLGDADLLGEVLSVAPTASAVIVTGSLAAGFGNRHSDIDLVCVMADGRFSKLPIMIYRGEVKIDCEYWSLSDLESARDLLAPARIFEAMGDVNRWKKLTRAVLSLTKLNIAYVLHATPQMNPLFEYVDATDFADSVRLWWRLESLRLLTAARRLVSAAPRLANNLYSESTFAALSARATRQSLLFSKKWLGEKFRRLEDQPALALYRLALMLPGGEEPEARARCLQLDEALSDVSLMNSEPSPPVELGWWLTPAAKLNTFSDCVLLWQGKIGYDFPRRHAVESWRPGQKIGDLRSPDYPETLAASLFEDGMIWPGITVSNRDRT